MIILRNHFNHQQRMHIIPSLRLEEEQPEETQILEIEVEIDDARRNGTSTDSLKKQREQIIESWIGRLEREIDEAGKDVNRKNQLRNQLRRAKDYSNVKFEH